MTRQKIRTQTRASRDRYNFWMKLVVWAFIFIFGISVAGGMLILSSTQAR
jgi:hypothetical protein